MWGERRSEDTGDAVDDDEEEVVNEVDGIGVVLLRELVMVTLRCWVEIASD